MTRVSMSGITRRLDQLEAACRRPLGAEAFAQLPNDQLEAALEVLREAMESGDHDDVDRRLAMVAPAFVMACGTSI